MLAFANQREVRARVGQPAPTATGLTSRINSVMAPRGGKLQPSLRIVAPIVDIRLETLFNWIDERLCA